MFLFEFIFAEVGVCSIVSLYEICFNFIVDFLAMFFVSISALCFSIACVIGFLAYLFAEFFIVCFVVVFALNIGSEFLRKFFLQFAHGFNGFVCHFEGVD